jgi:hypothetical protein
MSACESGLVSIDKPFICTPLINRAMVINICAQA